MSLPPGELLWRRFVDDELGQGPTPPALGELQPVRAALEVYAHQRAHIAADGLAVPDGLAATVVTGGEDEVQRLGERGLAGLVVALDNGDAGGWEGDGGLGDTAVVLEVEFQDLHAAPPMR